MRRLYWVVAGGVLLTLAVAQPFKVRAQGNSVTAQRALAAQQLDNGLDFEQVAREWEARSQEIAARVAEEMAKLEQNLAGREEGLDQFWEQKAESLSDALAAQIEAQAEALADHAAHGAKHRIHMAWSDEGGWLGIDIVELTREKISELKLPSAEGVLVVEVVKDSPAAKAGLKEGDIITSYNGEKVEGTVQFHRLVRETPAGRTVQITVWREGHAENLSVQVSNRREQWDDHVKVFDMPDMDWNIDLGPMVAPFGTLKPVLGIRAEDISGQLANYFAVPGGQGVLVAEVNAGSPAEKAGLKAGDVIVRVNGQAVATSRELRSQLREKREQKSITLGVIRQGKEIWLTVEVEHQRAPKPASMAHSQAL